MTFKSPAAVLRGNKKHKPLYTWTWIEIHGLCRAQDVHLISSCVLFLPFHLSSCCFQRYSELFSLHILSCVWTHSARRVQSESKQSVRQQKAACPYMRGPKADQHYPPPPLLLQSPPSTPIPALPSTRKPHQSPASTLQNACLSTFTPPPQRKSDYNSKTVRLHLYLCLSYLHPHKLANSLLFSVFSDICISPIF